MRVTVSDNYWHDDDCPFRDCERFYCGTHRLLYRQCDSATEGYEGDFDVINGTRTVWESGGDCPECLKVSRRREAEGIVAQWKKQEEQHVARTGQPLNG